MYDAKYIVFDGDLFDYAVIFSNPVKHSTIATLIGDRVLGAGFVRFCDGHVDAYGESTSLKTKSRPEDTKIIAKHLRMGDA